VWPRGQDQAYANVTATLALVALGGTSLPIAYPPELSAQSMVELTAGTYRLRLGLNIEGVGTTEVTVSSLMAVILPPAP
jgi:hypothetical protein